MIKREMGLNLSITTASHIFHEHINYQETKFAKSEATSGRESARLVHIYDHLLEKQRQESEKSLLYRIANSACTC